MAHGTQKLFAFPAGGPPKPIDLTSLMGVAGGLEVVGGTLLLIGLLSRPIAFLLSGEMAFAYFMRHAANGFWPVLNGGELAVLYCFLFLFFAARGGGPFSVSSTRARLRILPGTGRTGSEQQSPHQVIKPATRKGAGFCVFGERTSRSK